MQHPALVFPLGSWIIQKEAFPSPMTALPGVWLYLLKKVFHLSLKWDTDVPLWVGCLSLFSKPWDKKHELAFLLCLLHKRKTKLPAESFYQDPTAFFRDHCRRLSASLCSSLFGCPQASVLLPQIPCLVIWPPVFWLDSFSPPRETNQLCHRWAETSLPLEGPATLWQSII